MKSRVHLAMLPVLLAMIVLASSKKAEAFDVGVGVNVGGGHHYRNGAVVEYRTSDPAYTTWYPDSDSSYVYAAPTTYYDNTYVDTTPTYVYSTDSTGYVGWYGGGRSGHGGNYGGGRGERGGGGRSSGGGGGHRR